MENRPVEFSAYFGLKEMSFLIINPEFNFVYYKLEPKLNKQKVNDV